MNFENYLFYISSWRKRYNIEKKIYKINIFKTLKIVFKKKIKLYYIILYYQIKLNYIKYCMYNWYSLHYQFNVI